MNERCSAHWESDERYEQCPRIRTTAESERWIHDGFGWVCPQCYEMILGDIEDAIRMEEE